MLSLGSAFSAHGRANMTTLETLPHPGTRVFVHSLLRNTALNGYFGIVLEGESAHGRCALRIEGVDKSVSIKSANITCVKPSHEVTVGIGDDGAAFDQSKMLRGDCVICLGEARATRARVPCGHLCVCAECVTDVLQHRRCPVCRHAISSFLKVFVAGDRRDRELEAAISRAKKAEAQVVQLTERLNQERTRGHICDGAPLTNLTRRDMETLDDMPLTSFCEVKRRRAEKEPPKEKKHKTRGNGERA